MQRQVLSGRHGCAGRGLRHRVQRVAGLSALFGTRFTRAVTVAIAATAAAAAPFALGTGFAALGCGCCFRGGCVASGSFAVGDAIAVCQGQVLLRAVAAAAFTPVAATAPAAAASVAGFAFGSATFRDRHRDGVHKLLHHTRGADFVRARGALGARAAAAVVVARRAGFALGRRRAFDGGCTFSTRAAGVAVATTFTPFTFTTATTRATVATSAAALAASFTTPLVAFTTPAIALVGGRCHNGCRSCCCHGRRHCDGR